MAGKLGVFVGLVIIMLLSIVVVLILSSSSSFDIKLLFNIGNTTQKNSLTDPYAKMQELINRSNAIEQDIKYVDSNDFEGFQDIKRNLSTLETEVNAVLSVYSTNTTIVAIQDREKILIDQINTKEKNYYYDILIFGLKGIFAGMLLYLGVIALPYRRYRRGKLYGLIGHGGEGEYAKRKFVKSLSIMMGMGLCIVVISIGLLVLNIVLI